MRITRRTRGGVLAVDERIEVDDAQAQIHGRTQASVRLSAEQCERLGRLAREVTRVAQPVIHQDEASVADVDGGVIQLSIDAESGRRTLELRAGDDAAEPVWGLLDALDDLEREARRQQR